MKSFITTIPGSILLGSLIVSLSILISSGVIKIQGLTPNTQPSLTQGQTPSQVQPQPQVTPGQKVDVAVGHLPPIGDPSAKVKIIEFGDFRCPFCDKFFKETEPQLLNDYVKTGKAVFYFRHFQFLAAASVTAGNASECANEQNKFWDYHNYLYQNQPDESDTSMYNTDKLTSVAGSLGLNTDQFKSCLDSKKYDKNVQDDYAAGQKAGVSGTPTFYINGIQLVGAQPYSALKTVIDQQLAK